MPINRKLFVPPAQLPPARPGPIVTTGVSGTGASFKPGLTVDQYSGSGNTARSGGGGGGGGNFIPMAKGLWDMLPPESQATILAYAKNKGKSLMNRKKSSGNGGGGGSSYALSKAPNPSNVGLNSGILPNAYVSDYLDAEYNKCSPLHMTGALIRIPDSATGSKLYTYFNTVIAFDLQTKAQANVGFNLNVNTVFTTANILTAMNDLMYALQVYFYHTSIITYHSDPANKNEGMIKLRSLIDVNVVEALAQLNRRLSDTPCPPNLLEVIRYLSGNFYSGSNQGSAMIKISPMIVDLTAQSGFVSSTAILSALEALSSGTNNEVFSLLRRAVPQWRPVVLKDVPMTPSYDANFSTIFSNLPFSIQPAVATVSDFPAVASVDTEIPYNTFTNKLDGLAFSLTSVYVTGSTHPNPGLMMPVSASGSATGNTRYSYYQITDGGTKQFYASHKYNFTNRSRQDTLVTNEAASSMDSPHLYGADRLKGVSANTITESCLSSLEWLMSLDTIKKGLDTTTFKRR